MRNLRYLMSILLLALCFTLSFAQTPKLTWGEWDSSAITTFLRRTGGDMLSVIKVSVPNCHTVRFASRELVEQKNIGNCEYVIVVRPKISQLSVAIDNERPIVIDMRNPYRFGFRERKGYTLTIGEHKPQVDEQKVPVGNNSTTVNESSVPSNSNYKIEEFKELPTDISARTNQVLDADGVPCALIKVNVIANDFKVRNNDYIIQTKPGGLNEYWIYVSEKTNEFSLVIDDNEVSILFSDYLSTNLESKKTYLIVIESRTTNVNSVKPKTNWEKKDCDFYDGLLIMMRIDDILGCHDKTSAGLLIYNSVWEKYKALSPQKKKEVFNLLESASDKGIPIASSFLATITEGVEWKYYHSLCMDQHIELQHLIRWKFLKQLKTPHPYSIAFYGNSQLNCPKLEQALSEYNKLKSYFRGNENVDQFYNYTKFGFNAAFLSSISNGVLYFSSANTEQMSRWYAGLEEMRYIFLALEQKWFEIVDECKSLHSNNPSLSLKFSTESTREYLNYFVDFWGMGFSIRNNRKKR